MLIPRNEIQVFFYSRARFAALRMFSPTDWAKLGWILSLGPLGPTFAKELFWYLLRIRIYTLFSFPFLGQRHRMNCLKPLKFPPHLFKTSNTIISSTPLSPIIPQIRNLSLKLNFQKAKICCGTPYFTKKLPCIAFGTNKILVMILYMLVITAS